MKMRVDQVQRKKFDARLFNLHPLSIPDNSQRQNSWAQMELSHAILCYM